MQTLRASKYGLSVSMLSPAILDVIDGLTKAGYEAYIVGGGVRDLLLGERPKDFDAVTNATPSQIKQVFGRRCRIIGRRFELAHVHCGREIIEVATFRAPPKKSITNASGMILRDNNWGTIEQDFARRDFSVNSMYYQPRKNIILDFCNAMTDIRQKRLRLLGNAAQRFEEDPVRLLRALRFAAKLNFELDDEILAAFDSAHVRLLGDVSPHRLYDETQKMFGMGKLERLLPLLIEFGIWQQLFSDVPAVITPLIEKVAHNTDERLAQDKTINPAFFYAVLLWQPYIKRMEFYLHSGVIDAEARIQASIDVLKRQAVRTIMPRFAETFIREVWELQVRLVQPKPQHIMQLVAHAKFRAGFDFLMLREQVQDGDTHGMGQWWHDFQFMNNDQKERAISQYRRSKNSKAAKNTAKSDPVDDILPPLVLEPEVNSRAARRAKQKAAALQQRQQTASASEHHDKAAMHFNAHQIASQDNGFGIDHPIRKRKRVQRDLKDVVFGPIL